MKNFVLPFEAKYLSHNSSQLPCVGLGVCTVLVVDEVVSVVRPVVDGVGSRNPPGMGRGIGRIPITVVNEAGKEMTDYAPELSTAFAVV